MRKSGAGSLERPAEEQFHTALPSRAVIGQAKGILMHRDNLTGLQAFALLARASQETNTNWPTWHGSSSQSTNAEPSHSLEVIRCHCSVRVTIRDDLDDELA
jgi:hypothetical protein